MRPAALITSLFIASLLALVSAQGTAPGAAAAPLTLVARDGRRPVPTTIVNGQEMVGLDDVARLFQVTVREDTLAGGVTVSYRGRTVVVSPDQPMASVNGRVIALPAAATRTGNRWFVPLEFLPRALAPIYDARIELRRPSRLLLVGDVRVPRVTARIDASAPPQTRATIDVAPPAAANATVEAGRVVVRVEADALDATFPSGAGLIDSIRLDQPNSIAVVLSPRYMTARATSVTADDATHVTIEVAAAQTESPAPAPPTTAAPPAPEEGQPARALVTIVLDPGHGGADAGVHGASGLVEKDVTLDVARRLRMLIETRLGWRVVLTRDEDRALSVDERTAVANNSHADLFVSLHMNAGFSRALSGAEIYTLAPAAPAPPAEDGGAVALPVLGGGTRRIEVIPWDQAQSRHLDASMRLASLLDEELRKQVPMAPAAVRRAPLRVLAAANMPAALVEMAYLTNSAQDTAAQTPEFRATIAQALFAALTRMRPAGEERP